MNKIEVIGQMDGTYELSNRVYLRTGIAPTITTNYGGDKVPHILEVKKMDEIQVIGQMDNSIDHTFESCNHVYGIGGVAPSLQTGVNTSPRVLEVEVLGGMGEKKSNGATQYFQQDRVYNTEKISPALNGSDVIPNIVHVKQATKDPAPCKIGGVADLNYPDSKTRRGRVIENGEVSPTLTTENIPSVLEPWIWEVDGERYLIRIRKLTPRECWRLMDFSDEDFDKAQAVNSNTQLYKQAGNSIVKNVLCEVFRQLIE